MRTLRIILGPTASGKTSFGIEEALRCGSPVISCDSRQIFKEMRIGTAVPSEEELAKVQHYFIQTESVTREYSAGDYERDALELIERLFSQGYETLVMVGGSMMYIDAVCKGLDDMPSVNPRIRENLMKRLETEGLESLCAELKEYDPESYSEIELSNGRRVVRALEVYLSSGKPYSSFKSNCERKRGFRIEKIGLSRQREELYDRINRRVDIMMEEGLLKEAASLIEYRNMPALQTVGYRELFDYFDGNTPLERAVELIKQNTRHYAKRQMTWWRRDEDIRWVQL